MEFLKVVRKLAHSLGAHPNTTAPPPTDEERLAAEARHQERRLQVAEELAATMKAAEEARLADVQEHQERLQRIQQLVDPKKPQPYRSANAPRKKKKSARR